MMIDGKTRTLGLLGDPVEHTMSPLIHNTLSETLGLNNVYVPFHKSRRPWRGSERSLCTEYSGLKCDCTA